jgi:hypothetical protein
LDILSPFHFSFYESIVLYVDLEIVRVSTVCIDYMRVCECKIIIYNDFDIAIYTFTCFIQ